MKTYPTPQLLQGTIAFLTTPNNPRTFDVVSYVLSQFPYLESKNVSGYSSAFKSLPNPLDLTVLVGGIAAKMVIQDTQNEDDFKKIWKPVFDHVRSTWPDVIVVEIYKKYPTQLAWFADNKDTQTAGLDEYIGSRLLDGDAITKNLTALSLAFQSLAAGGSVSAFLVSGKGVWNAKPRGGGNSVCPAWRTAYLVASQCFLRSFPILVTYMGIRVATAIEFTPLNTTAKIEAQTTINGRLDAVRKLAPNMGVYQNEVSISFPWAHD